MNPNVPWISDLSPSEREGGEEDECPVRRKINWEASRGVGAVAGRPPAAGVRLRTWGDGNPSHHPLAAEKRSLPCCLEPRWYLF